MPKNEINLKICSFCINWAILRNSFHEICKFLFKTRAVDLNLSSGAFCSFYLAEIFQSEKNFTETFQNLAKISTFLTFYGQFRQFEQFQGQFEAFFIYKLILSLVESSLKH